MHPEEVLKANDQATSSSAPIPSSPPSPSLPRQEVSTLVISYLATPTPSSETGDESTQPALRPWPKVCACPAAPSTQYADQPSPTKSTERVLLEQVANKTVMGKRPYSMFQENENVDEASDDKREIKMAATAKPEDVPSIHKPLKLGHQAIRIGLSRSRPVKPLLKQRRIDP